MVIRKAKLNDLEEIAKIYKKSYSERPYFEKWRETIVVKNLKEEFKVSRIYVAEVEGKIAGFILFSIYDWHNGKWAYIEDFATLKEYRGQGLGKALMDKVESDAKKAKVKTIVLDVHRDSKAIEMYRRGGYKENGYVAMQKKLR
jgi:ribosomal protein S18 acetylase RimI-like enzyme